jgi:predicted methyltransferase
MIVHTMISSLALVLLPIGALGAQEITVNLDAEGRPADEKARDATSKPMEVLEWIGLEEGQIVLDIQSGGGYHMWIFSDAVGPEGKVYSQSSFRPESLQARIAAGLTPEANVTFVSRVSEVPDGTLDLAFTDRNYHDVSVENIPTWLETVKSKLEPGGLFVVIDAEAAEGRDEESHRIASDVIVTEVTGAGFELVEESDMLANPADDHVGPKWEERDSLDRSLIKFRKPAGEHESHM